MTNVNYEAIYNYLKNTTTKIVSASNIAYNINVDRIYGATMNKLVRDGYLSKCPTQGYYVNLVRK